MSSFYAIIERRKDRERKRGEREREKVRKKQSERGSKTNDLTTICS